jgi:hypothetical protein
MAGMGRALRIDKDQGKGGGVAEAELKRPTATASARSATARHNNYVRCNDSFTVLGKAASRFIN